MPRLGRAEGPVNDEHAQRERRELHKLACQLSVQHAQIRDHTQEHRRVADLSVQIRESALHDRVVYRVPEAACSTVGDDEEFGCSSRLWSLRVELCTSQDQAVRDVLGVRKGRDVLAVAKKPQLAALRSLEHRRQKQLVLRSIHLVRSDGTRRQVVALGHFATIGFHDGLLAARLGRGIFMDGRLIRQLVLHEAADVALQRISRRGRGAVHQDHVGVRADTMLDQSLQDVLSTIFIDRRKGFMLVEGTHEGCQVEDHLNAFERVLLLAEHLLLAGDVPTHVHEFGAVLLFAALCQRAKGSGGAVHDVEADDAFGASRREHRHQAPADHALGAGYEAGGERHRNGLFVDNAGLLSELDTLLCSIPVVASLLQLLAPAGGVAHASQPFVLVVGGARSEEAVPPQERRCIVAVEELVMPVVLSSAAVAWNQMQQVEREVVARMGVISHEQAHVQPGPHERQVVGE
mmetsp:Transcript_122169/g.390745  ORF Transcript_122169/g.390745 Transcript_122169/m.390745 type:complete len:462 (-) Transcript_122169:904-2289(-)